MVFAHAFCRQRAKIQQLGELVIATGADGLSIIMLAETKDLQGRRPRRNTEPRSNFTGS